VAIRSAQADRIRSIQTFGAVLPGLFIESSLDPGHPEQLCLHTWDGRKAVTMPAVSYQGRTYAPAPVAGSLAKAVRFPATSKPFGSAATLNASMREFLCHYATLARGAAELLVAFALASYFVDCLPVAPVLYLLGPENEAGLVLRLLSCLCRRPVLLADVDVAALATLPGQLDATLLINQRNLTQRVLRVLHASNDRHFCIARGRGQLNAFGAKAFSADPEFANGIGVHLSLLPSQDPLPTLTDSAEKEIATDFQAKLLRYRMVNHRRVLDAQPDLRDFVPEMRDEGRALLAPICDCPDLQKSVTVALLRQSREIEGERLSNDRCVVAEAAVFFCHKADTEHFFIRDLAEVVNALLKGRHEGRTLTAKKVGLLLRALGIHGHRVVKGYRISLTGGVREQIHRVAGAHQVLSLQDGIVRCPQCPSVTTVPKND
jgi:hypothetical protein